MHNPLQTSAIRRQNRQGIGLIIYRGIATFALLVAGFEAFPSHQVVFGLAVIVFGLGIAGIGEYLAMLQRIDNALQDAAERQTRFTILVAAERVSSGQGLEEWAFWPEVKKRVQEEREQLDDVDTPTRWYAAVGLTVWNVSARLIGDLVMVCVAAAIAGPGY